MVLKNRNIAVVSFVTVFGLLCVGSGTITNWALHFLGSNLTWALPFGFRNWFRIMTMTQKRQ